MPVELIQDILEARQAAENDFIAAIKEKGAIAESTEKSLRDGFLAGFYEAYNKLPELNKVHRRILARKSREKKATKPIDKGHAT